MGSFGMKKDTETAEEVRSFIVRGRELPGGEDFRVVQCIDENDLLAEENRRRGG